MVIPARTMSQLLTDGLNTLTLCWRSLVAPAVGASLVLGFLTMLIFVTTDSLALFEIVLEDPESLEALTNEELWELIRPLITAGVLAFVAQTVVFSYIAVASHRVVASRVAGEVVSGGHAGRFALRRMGTMIVVAVIGTLLTVAGLFLFVIPGIWVAGSLTVVASVVAVEPLGATSAIGRSFRLVRGRWWPTFGFVILVGLFSGVAIQLVQLLAVPLLFVGTPGVALGLAYVFGILVQGLVAAAVAAMITFVYIDLRARQETLSADSLAIAPATPL